MSQDLNKLSNGGERLFWRLVLVADDFGRFDAYPPVVKARCFPTMVDSLRTNEVERWMTELEPSLVRYYLVSGRRYGFFLNWEKHQVRRAKYSKFPEPPSDCEHMPAIVSDIRDPISESELSPKKDSPRVAPEVSVSDFCESWNRCFNGKLPEIRLPLSESRDRKVRLRLRDHPTEKFWTEVFTAIAASDFLMGKNGGTWRASFDWLIDNDKNCLKVAEGNYANKNRRG